MRKPLDKFFVHKKQVCPLPLGLFGTVTSLCLEFAVPRYGDFDISWERQNVFVYLINTNFRWKAEKGCLLMHGVLRFEARLI